MKNFIVNNKEYKAKPFDFNLMGDLEEMGVSVMEIGEKPMAAVRAYFALCTGRGKVYAGQELEQHIIHGGNLTEVMTVMSEEMDKSDFFRALLKTAEAEVAEN